MINYTQINPPMRVSVSEAAKLFGLSQKTIREAIKNNKVAYIVVKDRYRIDFQSLIEWTEVSTRRKRIRDSHGIGQFVNSWKDSKTQGHAPNTNSSITEYERSATPPHVMDAGGPQAPSIES